MATDVGLNESEVWRSVVTYVHRARNPLSTWENRATVPGYLDGWETEERVKVRGPYSSPGKARVQAGRDASELAKDRSWQPGDNRVTTKRVVSVAIESTSLAWEEVDVRDPEKGWGGNG